MTEDLPLADELAAVYARIAGLLLSRETVDTALNLVTSLVTETIPVAAGAGVTLTDEQGRRVTAAATDAVVEQVDSLQYEFDEGPCLSAWHDRVTIRVDDVAVDDRWPRWRTAVQPLGIRSSLSTPLVAGGSALGAVKVYSPRPAVFGGHDEYLMSIFAAQAAVLVANVQTLDRARQLSDQLKDALRGRDTIAMAKGILMARDGIQEETAFAALANAAQRERRTIEEFSRSLIRTTTRRRS
jgi:GAF domain-containing protein